jgi:type I restriction enzyme, R subunit
VDTVATGTDVRPIEVLIFMCDVKSEIYFEQMKGRGARIIQPSDLKQVAPDAEAKTRLRRPRPATVPGARCLTDP